MGDGRLMRWRATSALMVLAVTAGALAGCRSTSSTAPVTDVRVSDDGMHGAVLVDQYRLPDLRLTSTDGSRYHLAADTTKPLTLVFFGYTSCPDICQLVMADIASALTRLDPIDRKRVGMLFVSTDPARDDPEALRAYLDRFDPGFEGVTGSLPRIIRAGDALGVAIEKGARLPSGGYEVAHGTQIVAIDQRERAPIVWTEGTPADHLAEDLTVLLNDGVPTGAQTESALAEDLA